MSLGRMDVDDSRSRFSGEILLFGANADRF